MSKDVELGAPHLFAAEFDSDSADEEPAVAYGILLFRKPLACWPNRLSMGIGFPQLLCPSLHLGSA